MTGSLASVHPELIPEWSEKNLPLTPDKITFGSNKRVWWKGACGHEWETSVKARSKGEKCPICSGARVIEGINDLATLKPLLAQEWSEKNELKPTEVSVASHKKIIWKCKHGHEWEASVKSRTVNGTGCPYCSHNKVLAGFNDLASQYRGGISTSWKSQNESDANCIAHAYATQILIWETIVGERDASFNHVSTGGYNAVLECVSSAHPLRSKILSYYNSMVTKNSLLLMWLLLINTALAGSDLVCVFVLAKTPKSSLTLGHYMRKQ